MKVQNDDKNQLTKIKKFCFHKLLNKYNISLKELDKIVISNIIYNEKMHIVSCFKEFLIFFEPGEFLVDFYNLKESRKCIKTYTEFYSLNSRIFPNYILLSESKYIFNNIKKKQKLLDNIEEDNNERSQNLEIKSSEINNEYSLHINDSNPSYYNTIFTPSIINSIKNDFDYSITSNISKVNSIIDNINKLQNNSKGNYSMFKTPKNKNQIMNESDNKKNTISSIELFSIEKNKKNNSNIINKNKNKISGKEKRNKEKLIDTEILNNDFKRNYKNNGRKKSKNKIHKKTQSNGNIRNDIKIFKDDTISNKISMLLKTNCDIKILKNNYDNINKKNNNNLQKYIQQITSISKGLENNTNNTNNPFINKTSIKQNKISLKKSITSKANTTYTNKTQSQPSISYRHKKISSIAKSMPKLPTSFENQNKIKTAKNKFHNQLLNLNYQSLKNSNLNYNNKIKKTKNKITNRKNSYKISKNIKEKSLNNFYQIIQKNINSNIKYSKHNTKNNIAINNPKIKNVNKNKKNNIIPSLHISFGNIINNNNNTFIKCCSKSKSKSKSHSKSKSINKSNSIIRIIDENSKQLKINTKINSLNKLKIDIAKNIHKNKEGLQTERLKNNLKSNKINAIPKISFDVNINNNINNNKKKERKATINNKSYLKGKEKNKNLMKNLHINFKQANIGHGNFYMNKKLPQSARNQNNINNLNNNKNSNYGSETELNSHHLKPTTHRVFNKFNYQKKNNNKNIKESQKKILSQKNKNIYLINNYNINNINNNINFFSQQNINPNFNKNISKRNSINHEQGANIVININNNIFQNNKNNFNYNNYIYNSSIKE